MSRRGPSTCSVPLTSAASCSGSAGRKARTYGSIVASLKRSSSSERVVDSSTRPEPETAPRGEETSASSPITPPRTSMRPERWPTTSPPTVRPRTAPRTS